MEVLFVKTVLQTMDSFKEYLLSVPLLTNRIFISTPPNSALLIWSNDNIMPRITGVSFVTSIGANNFEGINHNLVSAIIQRYLVGVPILEILYDPRMTFMDINGTRYNLIDAATIISQTFGIDIGRQPAKIPNNPLQIKDPFHVWSRNAFDGATVAKTEINAIITNPQIDAISSLVAVKRSSRVAVGTWAPYLDDRPNYLMTMELSNKLNSNFFTIHHGDMNNLAIDPLTSIDQFIYLPKNTIPTYQDFSNLANTRQVISAQQAIQNF